MICKLNFGQTSALRGLYVNGFSTILGNSVREDSLLKYASDSSYNYLALYEVHRLSLSTSSTNTTKLASFIRRARETFGMQYIGAVGESYSFFQNTVTPYNSSRTNPFEKFNVFNVEFEFWINSSVTTGGYYCTQYLQQANCNCDTSGAFLFYIDMLHKVDSLANSQGAISETYVGWFNQGQGSQIQRNIDRVLLHSYRVNETSVYSYAKTRLQYLASNNSPVNVAPIFSSESIFMGPWLQTHSQISAYNKYKIDFDADNNSWKQYVNLLGYHWFTWSEMPKPTATTTTFTASISAGGSTTFCSGGSVVLTATSGTTYLWTTGATTPAITVTTSGAYSCQVNSGTTSVITNSITVTANALPVVSLTSGTAIQGEVPLTATVTSNTTIASYKWYLNTLLISTATTSTYTATASGDYSVTVNSIEGCAGTTGSVTVTVPAIVTTPPPTTCSLTTPRGLSSTGIDGNTELISWNSLPVCDSLVIRYNIDKTNTFYMITIPYQSSSNYNLSNLVPNKKYIWRIKTMCGNSIGSYSQKGSFTTLNTPGSGGNSTVRISAFSVEEPEAFTYPNPASDFLKIKFFSENEVNATLNFIDLNGRIIVEQKTSLIEGDNDLFIETAAIPSGFYFITIRGDEFSIIQRVNIFH